MAEKEKFKLRHLWSLLKETYIEWDRHEPFRLSAIVSYYAILSLPAMMVLIIKSAGAIFGEKVVSGELNNQIRSMLGPDAADSVQTMISNAMDTDGSNFAIFLGIATLVYGATSMFFHLQKSLNDIWNVEASPEVAGWKKLIIDRVTSFGLILVVAFLLLMSLMISAALSALSDWIMEYLPSYMITVFHVVNFLISFLIVTVLFAMMYKILPDVEIKWKYTWIGASVTAFLFVVGKTALGLYFGQTDPGSTYGAAGSIILILLWVSYSSLILFFGAEFTQIYARRFGERIKPSKHAVRQLSRKEKQLFRQQQKNST